MVVDVVVVVQLVVFGRAINAWSIQRLADVTEMFGRRFGIIADVAIGLVINERIVRERTYVDIVNSIGPPPSRLAGKTA